jgi:hypothetical protein
MPKGAWLRVGGPCGGPSGGLVGETRAKRADVVHYRGVTKSGRGSHTAMKLVATLLTLAKPDHRVPPARVLHTRMYTLIIGTWLAFISLHVLLLIMYVIIQIHRMELV